MALPDPDYTLDAPPDADQIDHLRTEATTHDADVIAAFDDPDAGPRELVVSKRGTCVLLGDNVSIDAFHPGVEAATVAENIR